uniref:Uncharacterized protein n=1 Tax=Meloidogyne incognita TaxID=6306 RepID=A0A914MNV2_MELIC
MQNFTSLKEASLFNFGAGQFWRAPLDLSSNKLTSLNIRTFEGLVKLERLLLFNNSIQNIHEEAFRELKNSLEYLNISHNLITKLPAAIGRLSRVETVDLSHNKISTYYNFILNKMPHLTHLNLSQNLLTSIDNYVFDGCESLLEINLGSNRIQNISPDAFNKCPKLRKIDLSKNLLFQLGTALTGLKSLRILNLSENALEEVGRDSKLEWEIGVYDLLPV